MKSEFQKVTEGLFRELNKGPVYKVLGRVKEANQEYLGTGTENPEGAGRENCHCNTESWKHWRGCLTEAMALRR